MHPPALKTSPAFQALQTHFAEAQSWSMLDLFAADPQRFEKYSLEAAGLFLDYSKNRFSAQTLSLLLALARERGLEERREAMFAGEKINTTEGRAVLHTALRTPRSANLHLDGQDISADVHAVLEQMRKFTELVRGGAWQGYTGRAITDIVNIGIGGSDLGPSMVCRALRVYGHERLEMHFVANADGHDLDAVLGKVDPQTTLFVVASKTFTTTETMLNAHSARSWFLRHGSTDDLARHFVAVSSNTRAVTEFGIDPDNMFTFWDWVGGRYSIWSAIGLPVMLKIGFDGFRAFLDGAHAMDKHFRNAPLESNMPVLLALLGLWYRNFFGCSSLSIAPYHQDLRLFAAYLQQLDMESNGKSVTHAGTPVSVASGPVIWGEVGTMGQHAYFQLLHQGQDLIPIDFIACIKARHDLPGHQSFLLANCFAQSEAYMRGKTDAEARADMQAQGVPAAQIAALAPHKTFTGNRPSNTLLLPALTPEALGALIALYEHKVFVQGVLWDVNSFDQWGVELGKVLAKVIHAELKGEATPAAHDASTNGLIRRVGVMSN